MLNFRVQPEDESDGPPIHGHTGLEIVWTAIPAVLVTAISVVSAVVLAKNDDAGPNPLRIAVTAQQFAWKFEYPGKSQVTSGQLVLPVDVPAKLTLNSVDVIHSFWVPEFGQKSDAVPGIETTLVITPNRTGQFALMCTELCGLGHSTMRAHVRVVTRADYDRFLTNASGGAARIRARLRSRQPAAGPATRSRRRAVTPRSARVSTRSSRRRGSRWRSSSTSRSSNRMPSSPPASSPV